MNDVLVNYMLGLENFSHGFAIGFGLGASGGIAGQKAALAKATASLNKVSNLRVL
ncbi:MAG: hypothetical protein N4A33_11555 [Bacteriovoracaceae bacterium]|jgi:hypothetical protein|nr:hypothetical protein [Bacteriovoracaceae bacterium]